MKKSLKFLGRIATIFAIVAMGSLVSCELFEDEEDADDILDDIINEGPSLDDGYYIVGDAVSSDTTEANLLVQGQVNAPDFGSQDRPGFFEAYVYMGSGSFSFIKVEGEEVTEVGGSYDMSYEGDPDSTQVYIGTYSEGGTASSPVDGLAHVSIDETTGQFVIIPVEYWEIIGDATEDGWGSGQKIEMVSSSAEEIVYEATDIILRNGFYKLRFNSNWSMPLEEDEECDVAATACYNYFTNFGGSINSLVHGGGNLEQTEEGAYTVTITYEPAEGTSSISADLERTGDAPEVTFDPEEYQFGIIGDATADGWDADRNMFYKNIDGTHTWLTVITFTDAGEFKFRINDAWDFDLGGTLPSDGSAGDLTKGGSNIPTPGAGQYYIKLSTSDEGDSWDATMTTAGWGIIGDGSPQGNWDADMDLTSDGFADGVTTYSITGDFTTDNWKFRAGDAWDLNLGGDMEALSLDGGDLSVSEPGNYTAVLSYDGETYSVTMTKN